MKTTGGPFRKAGRILHCHIWGEDPGLETALHALVLMKRSCQGQNPEPSLGVVDSQSVRTGLPHAEAGVDGGKKVKVGGGACLRMASELPQAHMQL